LDTKKHITNQLRRFVCIPNKQKTWLSRLTDDQLFEIFQRLKNGEKGQAIGRYIQQVLKVNVKSSLHSTAQGITKFARRIGHLLPPSPMMREGGYNELSLPQPDGDDPLQTLEYISRELEQRIKVILTEEQQTGLRFQHLNRDVQSLSALRKSILKEREWQMAHGNPSTKKQFQKLEQQMDRRFNALMENLGEDGQSRLVRAANRFLELVEQKAVPMYRKEDGTYTLTNPEEKT